MKILKPFRVLRSGESYRVEDALGRALSYTYFEDGPSRAQRTGRVGREEAEGVAKAIAQALSKLPG